MQLTTTFKSVLERSVSRAIDHAKDLQKEPEFYQTGPVGDIVREAVEQAYQDADVLSGIIERYEEK